MLIPPQTVVLSPLADMDEVFRDSLRDYVAGLASEAGTCVRLDQKGQALTGKQLASKIRVRDQLARQEGQRRAWGMEWCTMTGLADPVLGWEEPCSGEQDLSPPWGRGMQGAEQRPWLGALA